MTNRIQINTLAPEFKLANYQGRNVKLSEYHGKKNVVLIFNRGFT